MKIFIKLFTSILTLILLSFSVFGTLFFYSSFKQLLDRELDANANKTKMIAFALLTSVDAAASEYVPIREDYLNIMNQIALNFTGSSGGIVLYDSGKNPLFEKGISAATIPFSEITLPENTTGTTESAADSPEAQQQASQKILNTNDTHYIISFAAVSLQGETYILTVAENVEYLYDYRQELYRRYALITCVVILLSGIVSFALAYRFSKPISKLSKAAFSLAYGNYDKRIAITGDDELTDMMKSFNFMAKRLSESIQELEDAARRQEEFTGAFAHELKTPLTSIIGYSDMIQTMELTEEERVMSANHIYRQGKRLEHLSHSMLALCALDNGSLHMEELSVKQIVYEAYAMLEFIFQKEQIRFLWDVPEATVFGEKDLLVTLVGNLMDNGRKACTKGAGLVIVRGVIEPGFYRLTVTDNGCGIPPEDIEKVQEAFYMVDKSRSRKAGGVGLGLTLCHKIAELHEGSLTIQSAPKQGTTVMVTLPLAQA